MHNVSNSLEHEDTLRLPRSEFGPNSDIMSQPPGVPRASLARLALGGRYEAACISIRHRLRIGPGSSVVRRRPTSGQNAQRRRALDFAFDLAALPGVPP